LRVTDDMHGSHPRTIHGCEVLVTRNPCLHPGDLRKLRAVDKPELVHLTDCIIFPVKGKRPAADQMSGGDLDGDKCKSSYLAMYSYSKKVCPLINMASFRLLGSGPCPNHHVRAC
jgi:hypothetical protein